MILFIKILFIRILFIRALVIGSGGSLTISKYFNYNDIR